MALFAVFRFLEFMILALTISVAFATAKVLLLLQLNAFRAMVLSKMSAVAQLSSEDFTENLFGIEMYKTCVKQVWMDVFKSMRNGCRIGSDLMVKFVPNSTSSESRRLVTQAELETDVARIPSLPAPGSFKLTELGQRDVPLVLNFGSCS